MGETFVCSHCGQILPISVRDEFDGRVLCESCLDMLTVVCDHCETLIWRDDDCGDSRITLCERCRNDHYSECCECGHLVPTDDLHYLNDDDDEGYCDNCYHSHGPSQAVQSYYYKPAPIFYGEGNHYFGVELEIDEGGERDDRARQLMGAANGNGLEHLYIKHDGSLDDGMELVSHPMTLDYHRNEMPWAAILTEAVRMGYISHQRIPAGSIFTSTGTHWAKQKLPKRT